MAGDLVLLFYFFRDKQKILKGLRSLVPLSAEETDKVFGRVNDSVQATIFGLLGRKAARDSAIP